MIKTSEPATQEKEEGAKVKKEGERDKAVREARCMAMATIDRLGSESPAHLLCEDPNLFRYFCESFLPRHPIIDALAAATGPDEIHTAFTGFMGALEDLDEKDTDETMKELIRAGAPEAVSAAMQRAPKSIEASLWGCVCVRELAFHEEAHERLVEAGGLKAVVAAMKTFEANPVVVEWACRALANISGHSAGRARMLESGAIDALMESLKAHQGAIDIQERGFGAIANVAANSSDNARSLGESGAIGIILAGMLVHSGVVEVQEQACRALGHILSAPDHFKRFMTPAVLTTVKETAERFPSSVRVRHGLESLSRVVHPVVAKAIEQNVCTLSFAPVCKQKCPAQRLCYCHKCSIPMSLWVCLTCFGPRSDIRLCGPCMKLHHEQHSSLEMWRPGNCACPRADCKKTNPTETTQQQQDGPSEKL